MKLKNIIISFIATATIVSGLVVGFAEPESLTWDEFSVLNAMYNYEIEQFGGEVVLLNVNQDNFFTVLNDEILKREVLELTVNIDGEIFTKAEYLLLRSGLIDKYEQKNLIEKLLD